MSQSLASTARLLQGSQLGQRRSGRAQAMQLSEAGRIVRMVGVEHCAKLESALLVQQLRQATA